MPRNISFSLTTRQIRERTKTVTRRKGWQFLKPGDILNACVKCMGLRRRTILPGDKYPADPGWYDVLWTPADDWERIWIFDGGTTWGRSPEDDPESFYTDSDDTDDPFAFAIPGEQIERLCQIRVVSVRREPLMAIVRYPRGGLDEVAREGFPKMLSPHFIDMFCRHMGGTPSQEVTRIEFEYLT